jgi:hypothetical protein
MNHLPLLIAGSGAYGTCGALGRTVGVGEIRLWVVRHAWQAKRHQQRGALRPRHPVLADQRADLQTVPAWHSPTASKRQGRTCAL